MNTSALLIDILILGIQVIIWISGLIFSFVIPLNALENFVVKYGVSSFLFIIPIAYPVGIIFDHLIKSVFSSMKSESEKAIYKDVSTIKILSSDKEVNGFLENAYARLRIARASVFNIPFLTISMCVFVGMNNLILLHSKCATVIMILFAGTILFILARFSWKRRNKEYLVYIEQTKELKWYKDYLNAKHKNETKD